jgi:hypothetical protein
VQGDQAGPCTIMRTWKAGDKGIEEICESKSLSCAHPLFFVFRLKVNAFKDSKQLEKLLKLRWYF